MLQIKKPERPDAPKESRITIKVDDRGATLYCNAAGLKAIADQLNWIAKSPPEEHFECHLRLHLDGMKNDKVRLVIDDVLRPLFEPLPAEMEPDATPCGFEVTFMQVTDDEAIS